MRTLKSLLLSCSIAVTIASCSSKTPVTSPTVAVSVSPTILATATSTPTPEPTRTPTITPTNTPVPTISQTRVNLSPELYLYENASPDTLGELNYPEYSYFWNDLGNGYIYHFEDEEWVVAQPRTRIVPLKDVDTTYHIEGELDASFVQVWKNRKLIYSFPVGGAVYEPHTLLRYEDHWIFSFGIDWYNQGRIVQDGIILNDLYDYDTTFSLFLLDGKPFFFFRRGEQFGVSFHNEEIILPYSNIIYDPVCCEGGGRLNPRASATKVGFYVKQGDSQSQYIEIGLRQ